MRILRCVDIISMYRFFLKYTKNILTFGVICLSGVEELTSFLFYGYSQFHSASVLFRNSLVIQVTWRYVTWPNQPIDFFAGNIEANVNRQLSSDFVCLCLGKETIRFVLFTRVIHNIKFETVLSILIASKTKIKAVCLRCYLCTRCTDR